MKVICLYSSYILLSDYQYDDLPRDQKKKKFSYATDNI